MVKSPFITPIKVWVIFSGKTDLGYLKFLKPGFRHCYALIHDGTYWITMDPLASHTEIKVQDVDGSFDLPNFYRSQGDIVLQAPVKHQFQKQAPPGIFSCVEAIKRLIGLHKIFVITPHQLYRHILKQIGEE